MEIKKQVIYKDGRYIQISGGGGGGASVIEVDEIPETGIENAIYLLPDEGGEGGGGAAIATEAFRFVPSDFGTIDENVAMWSDSGREKVRQLMDFCATNSKKIVNIETRIFDLDFTWSGFAYTAGSQTLGIYKNIQLCSLNTPTETAGVVIQEESFGTYDASMTVAVSQLGITVFVNYITSGSGSGGGGGSVEDVIEFDITNWDSSGSTRGGYQFSKTLTPSELNELETKKLRIKGTVLVDNVPVDLNKLGTFDRLNVANMILASETKTFDAIFFTLQITASIFRDVLTVYMTEESPYTRKMTWVEATLYDQETEHYVGIHIPGLDYEDTADMLQFYADQSRLDELTELEPEIRFPALMLTPRRNGVYTISTIHRGKIYELTLTRPHSSSGADNDAIIVARNIDGTADNAATDALSGRLFYLEYGGNSLFVND